MRIIAALAILVWWVQACTPTRNELSDAARAVIVRSVDSATHAFAEAERARDPERVLAHVAPEFYMYSDGNRVGYDSIASQIRLTFPTLSSFETTWSNVHVLPLGINHALVTFRFHDRITDSSGSTLDFTGPTTLIWERRGTDWLIIYADADHYTPPQ